MWNRLSGRFHAHYLTRALWQIWPYKHSTQTIIFQTSNPQTLHCIVSAVFDNFTSYEKCRVICLCSSICWFLITSIDTSQQLHKWEWHWQAILFRQFVIASMKYTMYSSIYYTLDINYSLLSMLPLIICKYLPDNSFLLSNHSVRGFVSSYHYITVCIILLNRFSINMITTCSHINPISMPGYLHRTMTARPLTYRT